MEKQIKFNKRIGYAALGRNGYSSQVGVALQTGSIIDNIHIIPLNSKGGLTSCQITIERESLEDFIKILEELR